MTEGGETRVAVAADIGITTQHLARRFKAHEQDVAASVPPPARKKRATKKATAKKRGGAKR